MKLIQVGIGVDPKEHTRCGECQHMLNRHRFFMEEKRDGIRGDIVYTKCNCKKCKCDGPLSME